MPISIASHSILFFFLTQTRKNRQQKKLQIETKNQMRTEILQAKQKQQVRLILIKSVYRYKIAKRWQKKRILVGG